MKALITGSTGMIGGLVLNHCLNSDKIQNVISLVRKSTGIQHQKLNEVVIADFENYANHENLFRDIDVAFFCLGAYTGQVDDNYLKKVTVDFAVQFAKTLRANSPKAKICLLSGAGADNTEKSRISFARYKGITENQIKNTGLEFYSFRPGYIYPVESRNEPNFYYRIFRWIYPLIKLLGKNYSVKSTELASAMFNIGINGANKSMIENREIIKFSI